MHSNKNGFIWHQTVWLRVLISHSRRNKANVLNLYTTWKLHLNHKWGNMQSFTVKQSFRLCVHSMSKDGSKMLPMHITLKVIVSDIGINSMIVSASWRKQFSDTEGKIVRWVRNWSNSRFYQLVLCGRYRPVTRLYMFVRGTKTVIFIAVLTRMNCSTWFLLENLNTCHHFGMTFQSQPR